MDQTPPQPEDQTGRIVRIVLAIGILGLTLALFSPFVSPLLWAAILCYALYPLYTRLTRLTGGYRPASALAMCMAMTIGLIGPLVYLSLLIAEDAVDTYRSVVLYLSTHEHPLEEWRRYPVIAGPLDELLKLERLTGTDIRASLAGNLSELGAVLVEQLTRVMTNGLYALIQLFTILLCAFYFFRDGEAMVAWLWSTLPVAPARQRLVIARFDEVVKGAVYGNTVIALAEGLLGGLGFWLVGLPSAILWGAAIAILAYLPLVGAGLIWVPAALYMIVQGAYGKAAVLIAVGLVIAVMDYLVRTIVVGGRSRLHTLIVFFSVLGGIKFFGLVGIVAGPLVVAVGITLIEIYRTAGPTPTIDAPEV